MRINTTYIFLVICLCRISVQSQYILNAGFEDWDTSGNSPILENWIPTPTFDQCNEDIFRSEDGRSGNYSARVSENCDVPGFNTNSSWIGQSIEVNELNNYVKSIDFYYKMKIIEGLYHNKGCIAISVRYYYLGEQDDFLGGIEVTNIELVNDVEEWTFGSHKFEYLMLDEIISKIELTITCGSCDTGLTYEGDSVCYLDDISLNVVNSTNTTNDNIGEDITLFPNPTNGILHFNSEQEFNFILYNCTGVILEKHKNISGDEINLSHVPSGIYFIQLMNVNNGQREFKKIVRN